MFYQSLYRSVLTSLTNNVSEPKVTNRDLSSVKQVLGSPKVNVTKHIYTYCSNSNEQST